MSTIASVRRRENRRSQRLLHDKSPDRGEDEAKVQKNAVKQDNNRFLWSNIGGKLFYTNSKLDEGYLFSFSTILKLLFSLRVGSSFWSIILDCDEVYNFWEGLHLLLFGRGFQTWEYSPEYGIRSWAYIYLHYLMSYPFLSAVTMSKVMLFHIIRILIAVVCMIADLCLYKSVCNRLGNSIGSYYVILSMLSVAMFNASPAFLPSSFSMSMNAFAMAAYLQECWFAAIFFTALSALIGWPFAAILGLPIVLEMLFIRRRDLIWKFLLYSLISGLLIFIPMYVIDSYYYGKPVIAPLNIMLYNVFSGHGPDLYGTEPVSFYLKNLFLNWNVGLVPILLSLPAALFVYVFKHNKDTRAGKSTAFKFLVTVPQVRHSDFDESWHKFRTVFSKIYARILDRALQRQPRFLDRKSAKV
uniref:Mannosyltransferase n=1 Tax=Bursaphelenchus xylophilus TaxID=6326 RepID=A0A1I7SWF4_BURXY